MLEQTKKYVYDRRRGLSAAAGFAGSAYFTWKYFNERLAEVKDQVIQERTARAKYVFMNCLN